MRRKECERTVSHRGKRSLTPEIGQISVEAPLIAAKAKAGQFIILRVDEAGSVSP